MVNFVDRGASAAINMETSLLVTEAIIGSKSSTQTEHSSMHLALKEFDLVSSIAQQELRSTEKGILSSQTRITTEFRFLNWMELLCQLLAQKEATTAK